MKDLTQLTPDSSLADVILLERVKFLYKQIPAVALGIVTSCLLAIIVLWRYIPLQIVLTWYALTFLVFSYGVLLAVQFRNSSPSPSQAKYWLKIYTPTMFIGCSLAGLGGYILYIPDSLIYQLLLMSMVTTWAGVAVFATSTYAPAFYIAAVTFLSPVTIRLIFDGDFIHISVICALFSFVVVITLFYHNIHRMVLDSIRLRFEHTALAKELQIQKENAEQANLIKSRFLAAASHDLRQPLHALSLFIGELGARLSDDKCKLIVDKIETTSTSMSSLFNALLDISKLDAGGIKPEIKVFSINDLLAEIELESYPFAEAKGLSFRVVPCNVLVRSDPELLTSVLRNLVVNAIRYTSSGGIVFGCRRRKNNLSVEVWDSGIGIPEAKQELIFQEFYQLGNHEHDRNKGIGLGLAISYRIASLLGHDIHVLSSAGKGSRFFIEIPIAKNGSMEIPDSPSTTISTEESDLNNVNIIVIDDNQTILEATKSLLCTWGCRVITARTVSGALKEIRLWPHRPDFIITDFRLRGEDTGIKAITAIRSEINDTDIPIHALVVTGDTAPEIIEACQINGYPVFHKPVQPEQLRQHLNSQLKHIRFR